MVAVIMRSPVGVATRKRTVTVHQWVFAYPILRGVWLVTRNSAVRECKETNDGL